MSFFGSPDDGFVQGSLGPRARFFEGLEAGFNQAFVVDSQQSLQQEIVNRWEENLEILRKQQNVTYDLPAPERITQLIRARQGEDLNDPNGAMSVYEREAIRQFPQQYRAALEESLGDLAGQDEAFRAAGLPTFEEMFEEVVALQRKVEQTSGDVAERGGASAFLGQLVGGIGGSFSTRDPLLLATLPVGGAGRSVVTRLATEAVAAGAVEGTLQFGAIADNRRLAGLRQSTNEEKLQNVLLAAGGAAAIRGALFELPGAAIRRFRAAAEPEVSLDFEDAQLRQFIGSLPDGPTKRAVSDLLDEDTAARQLSPYGDGYQGLRRFTEETAEVEMALLGRSDTAIGRALPSDMPLPMREQAEDFLIVRERAPEVAARFDAAQARVEALDAQIDEVQAEVTGRTVIDAVRLVDENAAQRLEALAARTDLPEAAKQLEAEVIFTQVGKENILRAAEDAEIAPRKQTQRLRQQRKAANKEYRAALRAMETERVKLNAAADRIKALMTGEVKDLLGYAIATRPMRGSALAREVVAQQRELILRDADVVVERAPRAEVGEDGLVRIGNTAIPANFRMLDEAGEPVEVAALLRQMDEDDRLAEAMRSCSL